MAEVGLACVELVQFVLCLAEFTLGVISHTVKGLVLISRHLGQHLLKVRDMLVGNLIIVAADAVPLSGLFDQVLALLEMAVILLLLRFVPADLALFCAKRVTALLELIFQVDVDLSRGFALPLDPSATVVRREGLL